MSWKKNLTNHLYACERFIRFVLKHFIQDDCPYIASALAFTSLLAVVPLMCVTLAVFSTFPIFKDFAQPLQNFIFDNFVPTTGKIVQAYLEQFTSQVSKLSVWGILFLLVTALLMLFTIERAMNKIWRVSSGRHGVSAFLLYWSILSLAPVMIGLSIAISSYLFSYTLFFDNLTFNLFLQFAPFCLSLMGFVFLYTIVPNCPVKIRHAFVGGIFAAILFETAKQAFAFLLSKYNTYELLYGTFAILPLFFIWVYWVWFITLLGAEMSYAFSVHHQRRSGQALDGFSHALLWLHELWKAQHEGKGLTFNELVDASNQPFAVNADEMINALIHYELIHSTAEGEYMLSRDLNQVTLYHLAQVLPYRLPTHVEIEYAHSSLAEQWNSTFKQNDVELQKTFSIDLERLFRDKSNT
jgi:membrane protein